MATVGNLLSPSEDSLLESKDTEMECMLVAWNTGFHKKLQIQYCAVLMAEAMGANQRTQNRRFHETVFIASSIEDNIV